MDSSSESSKGCSDEVDVRHVFEWYAVRPPEKRGTQVCLSALEKRHVAISASCLMFRRVYPLHGARQLFPQPLEAFVDDDEYEEHSIQTAC